MIDRRVKQFTYRDPRKPMNFSVFLFGLAFAVFTWFYNANKYYNYELL